MISLPSALRRGARHVADVYDDAPWAAHRLADAALTNAYRRADERCAHDPEWSAIERRRRRPDGLKVLLSKAEGLGWDDLNRQREIRDLLAPDPWWAGVARQIVSRPVRRVNRNLRHTTQRARRGWSDADTWNLGDHLAATLADQLDHFAATTQSWPGPPRYPHVDDWRAQLRATAHALRAWAQRDDSEASLLVGDLLTGPATDAERDAATREMQADEEARYAAAQQALRWVSDNLADLWN